MCLLHAKDKKAVANSRSGNFYYIMAVLSIFNEILKSPSCLHLKEIYPALFPKTVVRH